jgi:hypothetical protein
MRKTAIALGLICILSICTVHAYEVETHEKMSENAVRISGLAKSDILVDLGLEPLDKEQPFPDSKNNPAPIIELFQYGANFEDDKVRPLNHFFDPKSGYGLAIPNARPSPDWALEDEGDVTDVSGEAQEFSYKEARQYFLEALTKTNEHNRSIQYQEILHERT